jgi:hypothetical protein
MGISASLVVVDQIDVAGGIRLFVVSENQPPVSGDSQAPESFPVALERMQLPAGKSAELLQRFGVFKGEQKLAQLVDLRRRNPSDVSVLVKLAPRYLEWIELGNAQGSLKSSFDNSR